MQSRHHIALYSCGAVSCVAAAILIVKHFMNEKDSGRRGYFIY